MFIIHARFCPGFGPRKACRKGARPICILRNPPLENPRSSDLVTFYIIVSGGSLPGDI